MSRPISMLLAGLSPLDARLALAHLTAGGIVWESTRVETGEAFRAALSTSCPGVILAGLSSPSLPGPDFLRMAMELCPNAPFLFISAIASEDLAIESLKRGATDYVLKRSMKRLVPAVTRALAEAALRRRSAERLKSVHDDLRQFAFASAHDLQEPLRTVHAYTQLLARHLNGQLDPKGREYVDYVLGGTRRMRDLLKSLQEYLDIEALDEPSESPVSLDQALDLALSNLDAAIRETYAVITRENLPLASGRELHYVQLLENLVSNAIKYRRGDTSPEVHVFSECNNGECVVAVRDNGIGIAPEYREQVFGIFKRLHGPSVPGTGIGLAICRKVCERYGGRIWIESNSGAGSTFRFSITGERV